MPVAHYIIPTVEGPYSRKNPQRPKYVRELRANWVGNASGDFYLCAINTTKGKHELLAAYPDVQQLPQAPLEKTQIGNLPVVEKGKIQAALEQLDLPHYEDETLKACFQRMVISGWLDLPNVDRDTPLAELPRTVQTNLNKLSIYPEKGATIRDVLDRHGDRLCPVDKWYVEEG
jgi:hypothetical protein